MYNEVFPNNPYTEEEAHEDVTPLIEQLVHHINSGLEIDVLMELWWLIIPKQHNVWYDEVEDRLHYSEATEAVYPDRALAAIDPCRKLCSDKSWCRG